MTMMPLSEFSPRLAASALALLLSALLTAGPAAAMGGAPADPASAETPAGGTGEASGGGSGSGGGDADAAGTGTACPEGFTLNEETRECEEKQSGIPRALPASDWSAADPEFVAAAVLVHSGAHEKAIAALTALGRPDDPYVLNYLGYASRKLGRVEQALAYYDRALAIRPDYARARSYLGEGYVALGRIGEAREQLSRIGALCGTACEAYLRLDAAIAGHLAGASG